MRSLWLSVSLCVCGSIALAADDPAPSPTPTPALEERVLVSATRLPDDTKPIEQVPSHVTIIDREAIERSGAWTLQDLLGLESGALLYDPVGNAIETRFDLRGFAESPATRVYLDGAPLNDTRNNELTLALVPLDSLERVEIVRGSAASSAGGRSEAGVIHLTTRQATAFGGSIGISGGSDSTSILRGELQGRNAGLGWTISGFDESTDGFRDNAGGDLTRLAGTLAFDVGHGHGLELVVADSKSDLGNPGALTEAEIASDPTQAPFNEPDFAKRDFSLVDVRYHGTLGERISVRANLFGRAVDADVLTTGRAAPTFGGFFLGSEEDALGGAAEVEWGSANGMNSLVVGAEWLDGSTDAQGKFTPSSDPANHDGPPDSVNTTEATTTALYVQGTLRPIERLTLLASARYDRDDLAYHEQLPDPTLDDARTFEEWSLRFGTVWEANERMSLHASYGESFLPPTVEQLFAFPGFFSNPDLAPQDSRTYEVGLRSKPATALDLAVSLFDIDTVDEIVFVPGAPPDFIGSNENVGRTRRRGVEASLTGRPAERITAFLNLTYLDAEIRNGPDRGHEIPLAPRARASVGVDAQLTRRLGLRADVLYVGGQVLSNDQANAQPELDDYMVVNARVRFVAWKTLELFAEMRNLLDEEYATRGVYAFDFSTNAFDTFFTPAPGRRLFGGATWRF
jgi:outer membrane receptor protein involved in Fe transport